jgi:transposase
MAYRYGHDRQQMMLFPQSIDQYVTEDHPVRAYDAFVDALDLMEMGIEIDDNKVGNSQYDPRVMLKLLLYGYSYGIKSSRKLEREIYNNLSFIWLMKNLKPDHKTIAEFRRKNKNALKKTLRLCAQLCLKLGLIEGNILFVDSTKIRANAGKANEHRHPWYQQQLENLDHHINELLSECERVDRSESHHGSLVKMPKELAQAKRLKASVEEALEEFCKRGSKTKNGGQRRINAIDPQSALMKGVQGSHPSYAVQSVVDDKNALIVHTDAVCDGNDSHQLAAQVTAAEQTLSRQCQVACADAGYYDLEEIEKLETEQKTVLVRSQKQASQKPIHPFSKDNFTYDRNADCYWCPQGHRLIYMGSKEKRGRYRIEDPAICKACLHFGLCTRSPKGRSVDRHLLEDLKDKIAQRMERSEFRQTYDRRKARVEHPFGYIKKNLGFGQFSLRGRQGARAETSLLATCFNITRMIGLLGGVQGFVRTMAVG